MNETDTVPRADGAQGSPRIATVLKDALLQVRRLRAEKEALEQRAIEPIAIVGMGCRFPGGAESPDAFWSLLCEGRDGIVDMEERWRLVGSRPVAGAPRWAGLIDSIEQFDAAFFGISPREAATLDPQHRLLLEVCWEALEHAGLPAVNLEGSSTGVFVGACFTDYLDGVERQPAAHQDAYGTTGNMLSVAAGRVAYTFGFNGPCLTVDTACSSSLVSVLLGCRSLRDGESSMALAGGVSALLSPLTMNAATRLQALSPEGRCKTFDASADGFARGEGCGIIVLKRLSDAQRDGDRIWAMIRGGAINQDGRSTGLTAPNVRAQETLLRDALANARIEPGDVGFVECHGTGTSLGDPIEIEALREVVGHPRPGGRKCLLGAVKTNVGHLEGAAGIAGLMKTVLALQHRRIPKNINFRTLNPRIRLEGTSLALATEETPWPPSQGPRFAGVSSFGLSGTNAHIVLEAPSDETLLGRDASTGTETHPSAETPVRVQLVTLSARSDIGLTALADRLSAHLSDHPMLSLADLVHSLVATRSHLEHRLAFPATTVEDVREGLLAMAAGRQPPGSAIGAARPHKAPKVVFVFPGQGSQWLGMGRGLLEEEIVFRHALETCDRAIAAETGWSARSVLEGKTDASMFERIDVIQPVLFAMEVALASLWRSWGLEPDAVVGHSMGEVAAAHVAGALSIEDAAAVICRRSRLLRRISGQGAMALVELSIVEAEEALAGERDRLSVAVSNSARSTVISGAPEALERVLSGLEARGTFCRRIRVDVASHSPQVEPLREELLQTLAGLTPKKARLRMRSTVTGQDLEGTELDSGYWVENLRRPVRFSAAVRELLESGHGMFLEMSPHPILVPAVMEGFQEAEVNGLVAGSLRRDWDERTAMLEAAGALWVNGHSLEWLRVQSGGGRRIQLPTYPWQRERHWIAVPRAASGRSRSTEQAEGEHPLVGAQSPVSVLAAGTTLWRAALDTERLPWLADHQVQGAVVMPGAAYLEMALAVGAELFDGVPPTVTNVVIEQALAFPVDTALEVEVAVSEQGPGSLRFQVASLAPGGARGAWRTHVHGVLKPDQHLSAKVSDTDAGWVDGAEKGRADSARSLDTAALCERLGPSWDPETIYATFHEMGIELGPALQGLLELRAGDKEALGRVRLPEVAGGDAGYRLHPALLDACFQVIVGAVGDKVTSPWVPVEFGTLRFYSKPEGTLWCHARVLSRTRDRRTAELVVADEDGRILFEVSDLVVQRVASEVRREEDEWFLALEWEPCEVSTPTTSDGRYLILGNGDGIGAALQASLAGAGHTAVQAISGGRRSPDDNVVGLDDSSPDGMRALLDAAFGGEAPTNIVHIRSLDGTGEMSLEAIEQAQALGCSSVLHLVQALDGMDWRDPPRLYLVTRGVQPTGDPVGAERAQMAALAQSPLLGLGRVIAMEHAALRCTRVDLAPGDHEGALEALTAELLADDDEEEIALRPEGRQVGRLVRRVPEPGRRERLVPAGDRPFRVQIDDPGVLDRVVLRRMAVRPPGPGEVTLKVTAAGMNFLDVMKAMAAIPDDIPGAEGDILLLGGECAGAVTAIGEGVQGLGHGQPVVALTRGAFASHVTTDARMVLPAPAGLTPVEAAALPVAYLTAWYALEKVAHLAPGERVLVHAATGGVGHAALQWARHVGAEVFATAGTEEKRTYLAELGVRHVSDSRSARFASDVLEWTDGEGVDVVLNSLSGELLQKGLEVLRDHGRFVELGKRDYYANSQLGLRPFLRSLTFSLVDLQGMMIRRPLEVRALLREMLGLLAEGILTPPPIRTCPISRVGDALRTMARGRHIGKLVVVPEDPEARVLVPEEGEGVIRENAAYLVTGGLGGLGLSLAGWLVGKGARNLALVGRSGARTEAQRAAVAELEAKGARVVVIRADVSERAQVARALEEVEALGVPLRGIFHAAGLLDDGLLLHQTPERFRMVFGPKVNGAWHLHEATLDKPLDLFVLYASAAGLLGSPGQGNHAAANVFLDALAHYRRSLGLPAHSIDWGAFSEVGEAAAQENRGARLAARGTLSLTPDQGLTALERVLEGGMAQVGVVRLDVRQWVEFYPAAAASKVLSCLMAESRSGAGPGGLGGASRGDPELLARVSEAAPDERAALLRDFLREQVSQVLRIPWDRLDIDGPLTGMGMDSLMGLELRNRIEAALALKVSATLLWTYPTVRALAEHLSEIVLPEGAGPSGAQPEPKARDERDGVAGDKADEALMSYQAMDEEQKQSALSEKLALLAALVADEEDDT